MASSRPDTERRNRRIGVALTVIILLVLGFLAVRAWSSSDAPPEGRPPAGAQPATLRLAGSGTVGEILLPRITEAFLRSKGATDVTVESVPGSTTVVGTLPGATTATRVELTTEGTASGFAGLGDGSADLGMASRKITDGERSQLAGLGDLTALEAEHVLALDALAVIVHPARQLPAISEEQLAAVYRCEITDWAQLGGRPGPIAALTLGEGSGTRATLVDGLLDGQDVCRSLRVVNRVEDLAAAVATDPDAIGYVGLGFVSPGVRAVPLQAGDAEPLLADPVTVSTESYPLTRRLYLYQPTSPAPDPLATELVRFALGADGQRIVTGTGFVSSLYTPPPQPEPACQASLPAYCDLVEDAERVPFDVRFDSGTNEVDNRAFRFLDLFGQGLAGPDRPEEVILVGFADNAGTDPQNQALSEARAAAVAQELAGRGVTVSVRTAGFGEALPVDTNDTAAGREQNRRVEVWQR